MDQGPQFEQHWYVSFVVKITPEFSGLKQHFSLSCSYSFFGSGISGGKLSQVVLDRGVFHEITVNVLTGPEDLIPRWFTSGRFHWQSAGFSSPLDCLSVLTTWQ